MFFSLCDGTLKNYKIYQLLTILHFIIFLDIIFEITGILGQFFDVINSWRIFHLYSIFVNNQRGCKFFIKSVMTNICSVYGHVSVLLLTGQRDFFIVINFNSNFNLSID